MRDFIDRRAPKSRRERGAAMVEFALVAPLFFFVVFAAIESGLMFRTHLVLEDMSRSAARVASIERDAVDADIAILSAVQNRDVSLPGGIQKIIIFRADGLDGELPPSCIDATNNIVTITDTCSSYGVDYGNVIDGTSPIASGYTDREEWEEIGIYVEYQYNFVTGFLGDMELASTSVEVIELSQ